MQKVECRMRTGERAGVGKSLESEVLSLESRNPGKGLAAARHETQRGGAATTLSPPSAGGESRREEACLWIAPLLGSLPTPSSRGEEEKACSQVFVEEVRPFIMVVLMKHGRAQTSARDAGKGDRDGRAPDYGLRSAEGRKPSGVQISHCEKFGKATSGAGDSQNRESCKMHDMMKMQSQAGTAQNQGHSR